MSDKIEGDSWPANAKWIHSPNQTGWNFLLLELDTLPECLVCRIDGYGTIRSYLRTWRWRLVCRTVRYQSVLRRTANCKYKLTSRIKSFSGKQLDDYVPREPNTLDMNYAPSRPTKLPMHRLELHSFSDKSSVLELHAFTDGGSTN